MTRGFALLFGAAAASIQAVVLTMRLVYVGIDIMHGYPWRGSRNFGFDSSGLWTILVLTGSTGIGLAATRDTRLATGVFWTLVMFISWACLLTDPYQATITRGFERTDATLLMTGALSGLILASVVASTWLGGVRGSQVCSQLTAPVRAEPPPGFRTSIAVLAITLTLSVCYHLLVPVGAASGGILFSTGGATASAALAAVGCFLLLGRSWGYTLADAAMGLTTLTFCGCAMLFMPSGQRSLAELYPAVFSAVMVGAAAAAGLWTHLACDWETRTSGLRHRLVPHAKRFAFLSGALALLAGTVLIFWPRLPGIAAMDHTLDRVASGFAANLFFLLVMLSCSRRLERPTLKVLTVLSAISTAGFLYLRMLPFTSTVS